MKEVMIQREMIQYSKECPKCKRAIKGLSESQVEHNLRVHLETKCKGVKRNK